MQTRESEKIFPLHPVGEYTNQGKVEVDPQPDGVDLDDGAGRVNLLGVDGDGDGGGGLVPVVATVHHTLYTKNLF